MNDADIPSPNYLVAGLPNEDYHQPERGLSCSSLKLFAQDPSLLIWNAEAPRDESKMKAIDFGTDFHAYFLEPDLFKEQYKVLPVFNRRKPAEKAEELELIEQWKSEGITAVTQEDLDKLEAMRLSAMAHPTVKMLMQKGVAEPSIFWQHKSTGIECKCRPDWLVADVPDEQRPPFVAPNTRHIVVDLKTIASVDRIQSQIENLKYYIQDAFYTQGVEAVLGGKVEFVFVFVSTSIELGRYPVRVVKLAETAKFDGREEVESLIKSLKWHKDNNHWHTAIEIDRPHWATNNEDLV